MSATPGADATTVILSRLVRDPNFQVRRKVDAATVSRYVEVLKVGNVMPPITVALVDGVPILIDGWHRVEAMEALGIREAEAHVIETNSKDARWLAAQANLQHGLPLKRSELRKVFQAYVKAGQHRVKRGEYKSYRDMQKDLSISYTTIRNWMFKDFRHIAARIGGDENFKGKGGLADGYALSAIQQSAMQGLDEAHRAFQSTADPVVRGEIVSRMDDLLSNMKNAGNWQGPDF